MSRPLCGLLLLALLSLPTFSQAEEPAAGQNRLALETSPYLRMHAENPIDWYPWGEAALAKAKAENKPIFLSVGYASCHWCHVMEKEAFSDEEIAKFLNEHFICIKVDREQRPDVDTIYMTAVQLMTGGGGWPLSAFLTPEGEPFFGGSYWPPRDGDRGVQVGFLTIIQKVNEFWTGDEPRIRESATAIADAVRKSLDTPPGFPQVDLSSKLVENLDADLAEEFDPEHGGFQYDEENAQLAKFPEPSHLAFLLHRAKSGHEPSKKMLRLTLDQMAAGGIHDQLAGGFHRYSVDRRWEIPHFEKMLYDNAQLLSVYSQAAIALENPEYRRVAKGIADFVLTEMTDAEGYFYAAIDADSEGEEGTYYRFTPAELKQLLSDEEQKLARAVFGLGDQPNFDEKYVIPRYMANLTTLAENWHLTQEQLTGQVTALRQKLLKHREQRERPFTDPTLLTAWNGLMIAGLADAGRLLGEPKYTEAAEQAARFVLKTMKSEEGHLLRAYHQGKASHGAYLEDYTFLAHGLIALHRATGQQEWLDAAQSLTEQTITQFHDPQRG
ncbi:MAG: thioredoxin domain-containing protein, partial [Pirellulaceae bacterium]